MYKSGFLLVLCMMTLPFFLQAQFFISMQSHMATANHSMSPLQNVIREYNITRPWLDKQMTRPRLYSGAAYSAGWYGNSSEKANAVIFEFYMQRLRFHTYAMGVDASGTEQRRDLVFSSHNLGFGGGYAWSLGVLKIGAQLNFDFGGNRQKTRVGAANEIGKNKYVLIPDDNGLRLGFSYMLLMVIQTKKWDAPLNILVRPFYSHTPFGQDFSLVETAHSINSATYFNDKYSQTANPHYIGINLGLMIIPSNFKK